MDDCIDIYEMDAIPRLCSSINLNQNLILSTTESERRHSKKILETLWAMLDEFTIQDYKSAFFLLLDYITLEDFLSLTKKEKPVLKATFYRLFVKKLSEGILLEMLGTMKMYKKLKSFNTCCHVFKEGIYFKEIMQIRKVLYSLCEEITDADLNIIKQDLPIGIRNEIDSAEEWFAFALQQNVINDSDISQLKKIFKDLNPECLKIIENYKADPIIKCYDIRLPRKDYHCGIAVIFNFETFEHRGLKSGIHNFPDLKPRHGSNIDVDSLTKLWDTFGFKTIVHNNLTSSELLDQLADYAAMNHSNYDIFVGCFLSHGDSGVIFTSDGSTMHIYSLLAIITEKCPTLDGKPKLFFIQACQGSKAVTSPLYKKTQPNHGNSALSATDSLPVRQEQHDTEFPTLKDVFQVWSTVKGYISWRSPVKGGKFIQTLCEVMMKFGDILSMDDIMIKVTENLAKQEENNIQIVPTYKTLTKKLMLKKRSNI